jgi:O-acetyl-ADP-ribose deacetylase
MQSPAQYDQYILCVMKKIVDEIQIEVIQGDITGQNDITAIVNAANAQLRPGGGVAGAIYRAAGPGLEKESVPLGPIKPGEAVLTGGHNLPNKFVIHCLGPVYGIDKPAEKLLADCYQNALQLADREGIDSVAFPAISTGAFGYPAEEAAMVTLNTIKANLKKLEFVRLIRIVLFSNKDMEIYEKLMKDILREDVT